MAVASVAVAESQPGDMVSGADGVVKTELFKSFLGSYACFVKKSLHRLCNLVGL